MSLKEARAEVEFDDSKISPAKLAAAIDRLGFQSSVLSVGAAPSAQAATDGRKGSPLLLTADPSPPSRMMSFSIDALLAQSTPPIDVTTKFARTEADALRLLTAGQAQLAFVSLDGVERAFAHGQAPAARFLTGGRILLALHVIVPQASPVRSVRQLPGKRFGVLEIGGVGERMTRLALQAIGLRYEHGRSLMMGQHVAPLKRGEIEALVAAVPLPSPLVTGLTQEMEVRLLPLDEAAIPAVLRADPALRREVIPAGSYTGQETDLTSVAGIHTNALVARMDLDPAIAHQVLQVVLGNPVEMQKACPFAKEFVGENLVPRSRVLPSHPGSERYFREKGT